MKKNTEVTELWSNKRLQKNRFIDWSLKPFLLAILRIMPKHPPPKTLKNLAFENIIRHMDSVWTSQYVKDWGNTHLLYVEGPFDCLTPSDCHWILSELAMRRILKRHHIYLLINPYLKILNLSDFRDASKIKLILDLALTRCRNSLKKIVLKFSQDFSTLFMPYLLHLFTFNNNFQWNNTKTNNNTK